MKSLKEELLSWHTPLMYAQDKFGNGVSIANLINKGLITNEELTQLLEEINWKNASWDGISELLDLHYQGLIDISDYWNVGDSRFIDLPDISPGAIVGESHIAQVVELVIADFNKIPLTSAQMEALGTSKTTAAIVFTQRNLLTIGTSYEGGYMYSTNTNTGGWKDCSRRYWCNCMYKAALPSDLRRLLKLVNIVTASGTGSNTATSEDYIFLPAEKEVFGSVSGANSTAESSLSQWQWFATSDNKIKKNGEFGVASLWWVRSPSSSNDTKFCYVGSSGSAGTGNASSTYGLAPCGCI